jgi:cold shock CspA family protein
MSSALIGSIVKWWDGRGYGFCKADIAGADYFLHGSEVQDGGRPYIGARVRFDVMADARGRSRSRAIRVKIL